jgi:hypothetical protein
MAGLAGFGLRRGAAVMVARRDGPERLEFVLSSMPSDRDADKRIRLELAQLGAATAAAQMLDRPPARLAKQHKRPDTKEAPGLPCKNSKIRVQAFQLLRGNILGGEKAKAFIFETNFMFQCRSSYALVRKNAP